MGLEPREGSWLPSERRLFRALAPLVSGARAEGLERFWFVRKDPALRLRFGGRRLPITLRARLDAALAELGAAGAVSTWFLGVYEPETHLLGGPEVTELVHDGFDLDTAAWMALAEAEDEAPLPFSTAVASLAAMVDLVERCVGSRSEIWDVWQNLHRIHGVPEVPLHAPAIGLRQLERLGGARARPIVERYAHANATLAAGLDALRRRGALLVGRRALLPTIAAFHWNRHRIGAPTMARLSHAMAVHYDPRRGLVGVDAEAVGGAG